MCGLVFWAYLFKMAGRRITGWLDACGYSTNVGVIWNEAVGWYEGITKVQFQTLPRAINTEEALTQTRLNETENCSYRHDNTKPGKFGNLISKSLSVLDTIDKIIASGVLTKGSSWSRHHKGLIDWLLKVVKSLNCLLYEKPLIYTNGVCAPLVQKLFHARG